MVGNLLHDVHLVRDEHNRHAELLIDLPEQFKHLGGRLGVEGARRLVCEQDLRVRGERACDAHTLFLAAGKLCRIPVRMLGEAHELEQLFDSLVLIVFAPVVELQRIGHVLRNGLRGEQVELLEDHADLLSYRTQFRLAHARDLLAHHRHRAACRILEGVDHAHQRGFAGSRIADDAVDVALVNGQCDIVDRFRLLLATPGIHLAHVVEFDDGVLLLRHFPLTSPFTSRFRPVPALRPDTRIW